MGKEGDVKPTPHPDERGMPPRHDEPLKDAGTEEREIDQTLADSFPASDAPSWTLGVKEPHGRRDVH